MNIVFIGCVEFSYATLNRLLTLNDGKVVGVVTRRGSRFNADFRSLEPLCIEHNIPYFHAEGNQQDAMATWIASLQPDVIYCFGWSYLLGMELLRIPRLGVIGYHPAALPTNRGRHPIIWALALGLKETASTFFFMDEGADSGDILDQRPLVITDTDDASSIYHKLTTVAQEQISVFTRQLASNSYTRTSQDQANANYWRKRTKQDGCIDWRMSARCVHNLVRALTRPYVGAHCIHDQKEIKIWKTVLIDSPPESENMEPGKIVRFSGRELVVKCGEGVLKLVEHDFITLPARGSYL
jgi:methionyl-tRNA formyltransferase